MINWKQAQARLGVAQDGIFGPKSYTALLQRISGKSSMLIPGIAASLAVNVHAYDVDATPKRLSDFLGQSCVESMGFTRMREIWGPTAVQLKYDQPGNNLGNRPGDAFKMRGAGLIEVTGRDWFDKIGHNLGLPLVDNPDIANDPNIAVLISLEWWKLNNMNHVSDVYNTLGVSRAVNRGNPNSTGAPLAFSDRVDATNRALGILS